METATGGTDTLLFTDNLSVAAVKVGTTVAGAAVGSFGNVEQVVITGGKTATFASAQVTGLSMLVGEAGTGTSSFVVDASAATSAIDLSGFKFATAGYSYTNSAGALTTMSDLTSGTDTIVINGSTGANTIKGTSYADIITGGGDADNLTGGLGADTFVFTDNATADTIVDFTVAQNDVLSFDISALSLNALDFVAGSVPR